MKDYKNVIQPKNISDDNATDYSTPQNEIDFTSIVDAITGKNLTDRQLEDVRRFRDEHERFR